MKIILGRVVFRCSWFLIVTYLLLLYLLVNLGFWQLNRAQEKTVLLQQQQLQVNTQLNFNSNIEDNSIALRYKPVQIAGRYDTAQQFLLDNQIFQGKAGYFVFTPFVLEGAHKAVLVNRGWLPANPDRKILPDVSFKTHPVLINGRINNFPSVGIKLTGAEIPSDTQPAVVGIVDKQVLAKKLGYPLYSFQVELDPTMADGYTRQWLTNTLMPPEQHFAYAMQWFGLSITLSFLFFLYSSKKQIDD